MATRLTRCTTARWLCVPAPWLGWSRRRSSCRVPWLCVPASRRVCRTDLGIGTAGRAPPRRTSGPEHTGCSWAVHPIMADGPW